MNTTEYTSYIILLLYAIYIYNEFRSTYVDYKSVCIIYICVDGDVIFHPWVDCEYGFTLTL
jgi:hypothetical protein